MRITPEAGLCANPQCSTEFRKLNEGKLYLIPVQDSKAMNLPPEIKQKSVWLCATCSRSMYIRFDSRNHVLQLCHKQPNERDERRIA